MDIEMLRVALISVSLILSVIAGCVELAKITSLKPEKIEKYSLATVIILWLSILALVIVLEI